jgi:hypothetical protein
MSETRFTIIDDGRATDVPVRIDGSDVVLDAEALAGALGWHLTPERLCRDAMCVPMPSGSAWGDDFVALDEVARLLGRPLALDLEERAAYLGVSSEDRASALASLDAPDFTLPDLDGRPHSLREHRGKKILLVAYASW